MRRALLIGVSRYDNGYRSGIGRSVLRDLELMDRLLRGLGWTIGATLGAGETPVSRHDIEGAVVALLGDAGPDDEILVYYSGHGRRRDGADHLVPSEARWPHPFGRPFEDLVDLATFDEARTGSAARSVTFVLDACRDGEGAEDDRSTPREPAVGPALSMIFATAPGRSAYVADTASVFTRALVEVVPHLHADSRLPSVLAKVQTACERLSSEARIPTQTADTASNVAGRSAPFPLFSAGVPVASDVVWRRATSGLELSGGDRLTDVLALIDDVENRAPDLATTEGGELWSEPSLPERLARSVALVGTYGGMPDHERLLLLGLVGVLEAGFRRAEQQLLDGDHPLRMAAVTAGDARLRAVLARADGERALQLRAWVAHLAAPGTCVAHDQQTLRGDILEVLDAMGAVPGPGVQAQQIADYVLAVAASAFDSSIQRTELAEGRWLDADRTVWFDGRRLGAAIEIAWRLGLDTRLCSAQFGAHLLTDSDVPAVLATLAGARWHPKANVVSLGAVCSSPVLDHELRRQVGEVSERLLAESQPGRPFAGSGMPVAATASGLEVADGTYDLPHTTFSVSTAEVYGLLMGTNFYGDAMLALREVYQNAVDACGHRERRDRAAAPLGGEIAPSSVRFTIRHHAEGLVVDCEDDGIGMSDHELRRAFATVGGRFQDLPEYLEEKAGWDASPGAGSFRPISRFGIGVLSYFMIAEKVELWTRRSFLRSSERHPALHVVIRGDTDLFRVRKNPGDPEVPRATGTLVRLHLRPDITAKNVEAALCRTIRAPRVDVTLSDATHSGADRCWRALALYDDEGTERLDALPSREGRVHLHPGAGDLLVHGIPVGIDRGSTVPALRWAGSLWGCTISLDGAALPDISVDRRTVRGFDLDLVLDLLRSEVGDRVEDWADLNVTWLSDMFRVDPESALLAYDQVRHRDLDAPQAALRRDHPIPRDWSDGRRAFEHDGVASVLVNPARQGLWLADGGVSTGYRFLDEVRDIERRPRSASRHPGVRADQAPRFDATLCAVAAALPDVGPVGSDDLVRAAGVAGLTVGTTAILAWAARFSDGPAHLRLTRERARGAGDARTPPARTFDDLVVLYDRRDGDCLPQPFLERRVPGLRSGLSPLARRLWSRDRDARMPWLCRWSDVLARAPDVGRRQPMRPDDAPVTAAAVTSALRELAPWFGIDGDEVPTVTPEAPLPRTPRRDSPFYEITSTQPDPLLSEEAVLVVSKDGDGIAPFFRAAVPALAVAIHGRRHPEGRAALADELAGSGYGVVPAEPDWAAFDAVADGLEPVLAARPAQSGSPQVSQDMTIELFGRPVDLLAAVQAAGEGAVRNAVEAMIGLGIAGPLTRGSVAVALPAPEDRSLHAEMLGSISVVWWRTVLEVASASRSTLGVAYDLLSVYRPMVSEWTAPDAMPEALRARRPSLVWSELLRVWSRAADDDDPEDDDAPEIAATAEDLPDAVIRLAARSSWSPAEIVADASDLLSWAGYDVVALRPLVEHLTEPLTFDDLLVLGTQQLSPPLDDLDEIITMVRPRAADLDRLGERAARWLAVGQPLVCD